MAAERFLQADANDPISWRCASTEASMTIRTRSPIVARPGLLYAAIVTAMGSVLIGAPADAADARTYALGGSTVADGRGVHGALQNPASLALMQRRGERFHFTLGGALDARDHGGLIDTAQDDRTEDLADDLDAEIDRLSGSSISCDLTQNPPDDTVCLAGTDTLATLARDALRLLDDVDGEPISGLGEALAGIAYTVPAFSFSVHALARGTGRGRADVGDGDRAYIDALVQAFSDDLTAGEIRDGDLADQARFDVESGTISFVEPSDVITSTADAAAMMRAQFGVSLATRLDLGPSGVDLGVTTKFSTLTAYGRRIELSDAFDDTSESLADQIEDTETEESSFTVDIGAATTLSAVPIRVAAVVRNLIPESIETDTGFAFDTDPQLIVGAQLQRGNAGFTADLALNEADVDGIPTQPIALGVELGSALFALRAGIAADLGREDDRAAVSAGVKLGPLEIGGRLSGPEQGQFGAQLAFSF